MFQLVLFSSKKFQKLIQEDEYLNYFTLITSLNKIIEHYSSQQT